MFGLPGFRRLVVNPSDVCNEGIWNKKNSKYGENRHESNTAIR
jgi:hypothetical protein